MCKAISGQDSSKYANATSLSSTLGDYIDVYDFDRCTGELSNHFQNYKVHRGISGGIAFSPDSRFLYVSDYDRVLQYDTWDSDLAGSEVVVAEYDGFLDSVDTHASIFLVPTYFLLMQNGPDGKIYIGTPNSSHYFHVIESPNEKGVACNVRQHAIRLPTVNETIPTFPHYRLGALEGSPCDTLDFSNNSEIFKTKKIEVSPNPASNFIKLKTEPFLYEKSQFRLFDLNGRSVLKNEIESGEQMIELDNLPSGIYFYKIDNDGGVGQTGKLIILK